MKTSPKRKQNKAKSNIPKIGYNQNLISVLFSEVLEVFFSRFLYEDMNGVRE